MPIPECKTKFISKYKATDIINYPISKQKKKLFGK